jgi:RNA polymerase sigma-70 factor (family 1)
LKLFPEDIELVERLQKSDVEAFDMLYEKYSVKLYKFSRRYLRSTGEAEEVVQSCFLKVWENHKSLNKELSFKSYLFTIVFNDICKLFRQRSYQQKFISDTKYKYINSLSESEESIDYKSLLEKVQCIINKLPERQRKIFLKSRIEGKSAKEIALEIGLSPATIDNYISESLKFLRSHMAKGELPALLFISQFLF